MGGLRSIAAAALAGLVACAAPKPEPAPPGSAPPPPPSAGAAAGATPEPTCPARAPAAASLPGVRPEHETPAYWKSRSPDAALLSPPEIAAHNRALALPGEPDAAPDVFATEPAEATLTAARERLGFLRARIAAREYVDAAGLSPPATLFAETTPGAPLDEVRVTLAPVPLRCGPTAAGLYTVPPNPAFDRNLCSTLPAQEAVRVVSRWPGGFLLVRSRAALGFVAEDAPLSGPLDTPARARLAAGPFAVTAREVTARVAGGGRTVTLPAGLRVAAPQTGALLLGTTEGLAEATLDAADAAALVPTARPLTRHAFLDEAFRYLGTPYGWGGMNGGRDCSQFVLEVLGSFGLDLPRNSSQQGLTGVFTVDVPPETSERERLALLDAAQASGVVLLHLPGHIMFYLGRNAEGVPMALHAFAEYVEPCADAPGPRPGGAPAETLREVNRVGVSTLELGRGTSRRAFLERLAHLTVFGPPNPALAGVITHRPGLPPDGPCPEKPLATLTVSPAAPNTARAVRVVAGTNDDPGPAALVLIAPDGTRHSPPQRALGGPPFGRWTRLDTPTAGAWTALYGDADRVLACRKFTVAERPPKAAKPRDDASGDAAAVWRPKRAWDRGMENLYALFVEQLFDYPLDDDRTWPNLQVLLQDADHNLLHDHLMPGEDAALKLAPDCADLPFLLRAYFAWKMRLPYAVRPCSKGGAGRPPRCGEPESSLMPREGAAGVQAFQRFADAHVRVNAQSASGRTHPDDEASDLYPVPLTREALRPGTVFADPYGHLLIVAKWLPQKPGGTGALIGAEAQPDATIGRRHFWRGSFLFLPETKMGGAGFKAFRPVRYSEAGGVTIAGNADLRGQGGVAPFSRQQYQGTLTDFYDAMDALMNPRPVEPLVRADALVAALLESAVRRTKSVQNGEDYQAGGPRTVSMPDGARIFQSKGAWEDYSTPSRDFRLLIALDTVLGFPDAVARRPALFGLPPDDAAAVSRTVAELRAHLTRALSDKRFTYTRSDGTPFTLRLQDLVERQTALEMAYNPNDCPEVRWGAPPGSPEASTCRRRAPAEQQSRMERLRGWFRTRTRPLE